MQINLTSGGGGCAYASLWHTAKPSVMLHESIMKTTYSLTESEYVNAHKLFTKPTMKIKIVYCILGIVLLLVAFLSSRLIIRLGAIGGFAGGAIGYLVTNYIYAPYQTKKQYQKYKAAQEPNELEILLNGLKFTSETGAAIIAWERIIKWRENSQFILIYQAPHVYHIIPKRIGNVSEHLKINLVKHVNKAT